MGADTGIEWTDATWNPLRGCTRVSEGCRNCYAEGVAARFSGPGQPYEGLAAFVGAERLPRWTGRVALVEHMLDQPLRWKRPRRIFVNSMSDLFHESVPDEWIDRVFAVMALAPQHTFQVLTKRPERMNKYISTRVGDWDLFLPAAMVAVGLGQRRGLAATVCVKWPLPNVWLGTSVEDQATADERIPLLLDTPSAKRFISAEPLLGPIDLMAIEDMHDGGALHLNALSGEWWDTENGVITGLSDTGNEPSLDWVIVGGESGPNARPMHPDWARTLRDQCAAAEVAFFFKQWGAWGCASPLAISVSGSAGDAYRGELQRLEVDDRSSKFHGVSYLAFPMGDRTIGDVMRRLGKNEAGALLDGREHREFPQ